MYFRSECTFNISYFNKSKIIFALKCLYFPLQWHIALLLITHACRNHVVCSITEMREQSCARERRGFFALKGITTRRVHRSRRRLKRKGTLAKTYRKSATRRHTNLRHRKHGEKAGEKKRELARAKLKIMT